MKKFILMAIVALTIVNSVAFARYLPDATAEEAAAVEPTLTAGEMLDENVPVTGASIATVGTNASQPPTQKLPEPITVEEPDVNLGDEPEAGDEPDSDNEPAGDVNESVPEMVDPMKQRIERLKADHETAGYVYEYLYSQGWSDVTIAGVLGNMMAECGGQALALQGRIYNDTWEYYGLCQWSLYYNASVNGCSIPEQMDYLMTSLRRQMGYFGGTPEEFFAISDAAQAARYFCDKYEIADGVDQRAANAIVALKWIQND